MKDILGLKTHCQSQELTISNPRYKAWVEKFTFDELEKDLGIFDITTKVSLENKKAKAVILAKEKGIFAGRQEVEFFLRGFKSVTYKFNKKDSQVLNKGEIVLELSGPIFDLMKIERIILNLIGRMSGVSTLTSRLVKVAKVANSSVLIVPTRKTLWGLLDKRACALGGGGTHRLALDNAVLIKHNHIKASSVGFEKFLITALCGFIKMQNPNIKFFEVEVANGKNALIAARIFADAINVGVKIPFVIMFDNMKPQEIKKTLNEIKKEYPDDWSKIIFEASGRINAENMRAYAKTGVNILSLGMLTHSAKMLDFSMRIA